MTPPLVCVVDASVAVKLHLAEPLAAEAHALFAFLADPTTIFHVPDLFYVECANILWKQVQRGSATAAEVAVHYAALAALPLRRTPTFDLAADALAFGARHHGLRCLLRRARPAARHVPAYRRREAGPEARRRSRCGRLAGELDAPDRNTVGGY